MTPATNRATYCLERAEQLADRAEVLIISGSHIAAMTLIAEAAEYNALARENMEQAQ